VFLERGIEKTVFLGISRRGIIEKIIKKII